jgi:hypothetical protein
MWGQKAVKKISAGAKRFRGAETASPLLVRQRGAFVAKSNYGLPIASAPTPSPYDADTVAAMVTPVKDFIQQAQTRLGLAEVDEVSMVVGDRWRGRSIVRPCRPRTAQSKLSAADRARGPRISGNFV